MLETVLSSHLWPVVEALATLAVAVYAAFQFTASQRIAERTIAETRRIGEAQVRAYLSCEGASYVFQTYNATENSVTISASIRNYGQSPATSVRVKGFLGAFAPADVKESGGQVQLLGSIPASGQVGVGFWFVPAMVEENLRELVFDKGFPLTLAAEMTWTDVFGKSHVAVIDLKEGTTPPIPPQRRGQFAGNMSVSNHIGTDEDTGEM